MVPVAPDMKVDTESPTAKRMQEGMLELLLANHPLDCPVCDKGGECPLQDQTISHGPGESRFVEEKRHYEKPIAISDLVFLDRERCILCDRCTRFADEVAGDPLIHFIGRGNNTQVITFPDEPFASYFSGNTVQICPVGALTAKPYRFKARPWDLDEVESTCTTCSVGCRTVVQSSRDELLRYQGVDSDPVNWGWLCDRGRFDFESVNSDAARSASRWSARRRARAPPPGTPRMAAAAELIKDAIAAGGPEQHRRASAAPAAPTRTRSPGPASAHDVIGTPNVYAQMGDGLPAGILGLPRATIDEAAAPRPSCCSAPTSRKSCRCCTCGSATRPRSASAQGHRVHAEAGRRHPLRVDAASPTSRARRSTAVDGCARRSRRSPPSSRKGRVVDRRRPGQPRRDVDRNRRRRCRRCSPPRRGATVLPAFRRGNVVGALQVGMRPRAGGLDTRGTLQAAADGKIECLVLVGADPLADFPDTDLARRALAGARRIIAVDTFLHGVVRSAPTSCCPPAAYAEKAGTTTNLEGRVTHPRPQGHPGRHQLVPTG